MSPPCGLVKNTLANYACKNRLPHKAMLFGKKMEFSIIVL